MTHNISPDAQQADSSGSSGAGTTPEKDIDSGKTALAGNIARYRQKLKLTRAELAKRVDVSEMAIGQYERGVRVPNLQTLLRLAQVLKVSTDALFGIGDPFANLILSMLGFEVERNEHGGVSIFKLRDSRTTGIELPFGHARIPRPTADKPTQSIEFANEKAIMKLKYPEPNRDFVASFDGFRGSMRFSLFVDSLGVFLENISGIEHFVTQMAIEAALKGEVELPNVALVDKRVLSNSQY